MQVIDYDVCGMASFEDRINSAHFIFSAVVKTATPNEGVVLAPQKNFKGSVTPEDLTLRFSGHKQHTRKFEVGKEHIFFFSYDPRVQGVLEHCVPVVGQPPFVGPVFKLQFGGCMGGIMEAAGA